MIIVMNVPNFARVKGTFYFNCKEVITLEITL